MRCKKSNPAELVREAASGDGAAFTKLVSEYRSLVFALCLGRTANRSEAEDLTQDVLVTVHQRLSAVREPDKFAGWLRRVTLNACRAWARKHRPALPLEIVRDETPVRAPAVVSPGADASGDVANALRSLSENSRAVLTLHYMGGHSYREIATLLGLPVATVKSRMREGRQQMKRELLKTVKQLLRLRLSSEQLAAQVMARCGSKSCVCARELLHA